MTPEQVQQIKVRLQRAEELCDLIQRLTENREYIIGDKGYSLSKERKLILNSGEMKDIIEVGIDAQIRKAEIELQEMEINTTSSSTLGEAAGPQSHIVEVPCEECTGSGTLDGIGNCETCFGTGKVKREVG